MRSELPPAHAPPGRNQPSRRHNTVDTHGKISWTSCPPSPARPARIRATITAAASRPPVPNGTRPAATTVNGSAGTASVHSAGRPASSPPASRKYTRATPSSGGASRTRNPAQTTGETDASPAPAVKPLHQRDHVHLTVRSNGLVESVNTKIRVITRIAFGFRNPAALIALAMLA